MTRTMIWREGASPLTNEITQTFLAITPDVEPGKMAEYLKGHRRSRMLKKCLQIIVVSTSGRTMRIKSRLNVVVLRLVM